MREKEIIERKGTEQPFTGELLHNHRKGVYICRKCGAKLYRSEHKFDSHCGWPSFDDEIAGAVKRQTDADGRRTEILCNTCGGHLGHVFQGEGLTDKNIRHCVNSLSMKFVEDKTAVAVFAGGCFWGVEDAFAKEKGVQDATSGYTGGHTENPTYEEVCTDLTGHAEAVKVTYNSAMTDFETLCKLFFELHDPTQLNRQDVDEGTQYRSAVFYADEEQKTTAQKLIEFLKQKGLNVVTELAPLQHFFPAENYHQDYFQKTGKASCHRRVKRF